MPNLRLAGAASFEELPGTEDEQLENQDNASDKLEDGETEGQELSDVDKLRMELEEARRETATLQGERDSLTNQMEKLNSNWQNLVTKQGVEVGTLRKKVESFENENRQAPKRVNITKQIDPILQTDKFVQAWQELADVVEAQNQELNELRGKSNPQAVNDEIQKLRDDIRTLAINTYRNEEEDELKRKYKFNNNDIAKVRSVMERSGIASPKAAAMMVDELEDKIASSKANYRDNNGQANRGPGRPRKEENGYNDRGKNNIGKEMLDTGSLSRSAPTKQSHQKDTNQNRNFHAEIITAIDNDEFELWPVEKQNEARRFLAEQASKPKGTAGRFMQ